MTNRTAGSMRPPPLRFTEIACGGFMGCRIGLTKHFQGTVKPAVSHGPMRLSGKGLVEEFDIRAWTTFEPLGKAHCANRDVRLLVSTGANKHKPLSRSYVARAPARRATKRSSKP